jgi:hypothetical protein
MITRTGFYVEVKIFEVGEVAFESKAAEHSRNSNDVRLLRDAGSEAVVLEDLKLKIEVILFARVFNFVRVELS